MKFGAIDSTADGRIYRGRVYVGNLVEKVVQSPDGSITSSRLRVAIFDSLGEWMTFDVSIFVPVEDEK